MRSLLSARESLTWLNRLQSSPPANDRLSCTSKRARSSTVDPSCAPDAGTLASPNSATRILRVSAQNIPATDDQNAVRIPPSRWGTLLRTLFGSKSSSPQAMPAKQKNIPSVVRIVGPSAVARRDHLMWNSRAIDDINTVENCVKPLRHSQMRSIGISIDTRPARPGPAARERPQSRAAVLGPQNPAVYALGFPVIRVRGSVGACAVMHGLHPNMGQSTRCRRISLFGGRSQTLVHPE